MNPVLIWFYPRKRGWPDLPCCQQSLPLPLSILLDSLHPPSSNQHSYSPSPLAISMSSSVILASFKTELVSLGVILDIKDRLLVLFRVLSQNNVEGGLIKKWGMSEKKDFKGCQKNMLLFMGNFK